MTVLGSTPVRAPARVPAPAGPDPMDTTGAPGLAAAQRVNLADAVAAQPFERLARLMAMVLGTPLAAVTIAGEFASRA